MKVSQQERPAIAYIGHTCCHQCPKDKDELQKGLRFLTALDY